MSRRSGSFDHLEAGTPEVEWATALAALRPASLEMRGVRRVVVLAAHPDDETLGAGGLMRTAHAAGLEVDVVLATDGEGSHPRSPSHNPAQLAELRRREVRAALDELAPRARLHHLGLPDGGLHDAEAALVTALVDILGDGGERTWLIAPYAQDRHPDHEAAGRAAAAASWRTDSVLFTYPVWLWHWGSAADLPAADLVRLELLPQVRHAKAEAMAHHTSQVRALSDAPGDERLLSEQMLAHFERPAEIFVRAATGEVTPFEALHRGVRDPWRVHSSWYEQRKRALTLAALPAARYRRVIEVGCSIGALTAELAGRAETVLALDESETAVQEARAAVRHAGLGGVEVARRRLPEDGLPGSAELVVLSEIGYFLSPGRLRRLAAQVQRAVGPGGTVLACHWRHPVRGWPLRAARVHEILDEELSASRGSRIEDRDFILDVWAPHGAGDDAVGGAEAGAEAAVPGVRP